MSNIYVRYTVQKGDTLWDLWRAAGMTEKEWREVNEGRDPKQILKAGEEIIIKDPITTCQVQDDYRAKQDTLEQFLNGLVSNLDVCRDMVRHASFKPLLKFTDSLKKPMPEPALAPGAKFSTWGLQGLI